MDQTKKAVASQRSLDVVQTTLLQLKDQITKVVVVNKQNLAAALMTKALQEGKGLLVYRSIKICFLTFSLFLGCGCQTTENGCCPDNFTPSPGKKQKGCPCNTFEYGCCPDGETIARGPGQEGCTCKDREFGCCPDRRTPASVSTVHLF